MANRRISPQCDGAEPCGKCEQNDEECVYEAPRRTSKAEMREEVEQLRRANEEAHELFKALLSMETDQARKVLSSMADGNNTMLQDALSAAVVEDVERHVEEPAVDSQTARHDADEALGPTPYPKTSPGRFAQGTKPLNSRETTSPETVPSLTSQDSIPSSITSVATTASPAQALDLRLGGWTQTGLTFARIQGLLESLFTWEYLPCCLLSNDLFLQDFSSGLNRYCSPALVYAVLSFAVRLLEEAKPRFDYQPDAARADVQAFAGSSREFFLKSEQLLAMNNLPPNLPDVQAQGILALVHVSHGHMDEARNLAECCVVAAADLCMRDTRLDKQPEQYSRVRAMTYCGAVTLCR